MTHITRTTRLWLGTAAGLLFASLASAQSQQCFDDTIPQTVTNWVDSVTLPKFDSGLGTLQGIQITLEANTTGSANVESLDSAPTQTVLTFSNTLTLSRPDNSVIVVSVPLVSFQDSLSAFDGTLDFGGTSGASHPNIVANETQTVNSPPPASDLALFTGPAGNPGTITLPVTATGTSIATGSGNIFSQFTSAAAAKVTVCYLFAPNTPPVFTGALCNTTLMATAGVPVSFQVCAQDSDPSDTVTLTSGALPAGATMTPPLPTSGNPVCSTFTWTPGSNQVGLFTFTFTATDSHQRTASCTISIMVAECHLLVASNPGNAQITVFGYTYTTQLAGLRRFFPVTMETIPDFPVSVDPNGNYIQSRFFLQLVMYNPEIFPTNPEQWSDAMEVQINPDGSLTTNYVGTINGITMSAETFYNDQGQLRMRFPFVVLGM